MAHFIERYRPQFMDADRALVDALVPAMVPAMTEALRDLLAASANLTLVRFSDLLAQWKLPATGIPG